MSIITRDLENELNIYNLLEEEEILWKKRSRIQWLLEGDKNIKFLHAKASQRNKKNKKLGIFLSV